MGNLLALFRFINTSSVLVFQFIALCCIIIKYCKSGKSTDTVAGNNILSVKYYYKNEIK
jgi:hypothetical protein